MVSRGGMIKLVSGSPCGLGRPRGGGREGVESSVGGETAGVGAANESSGEEYCMESPPVGDSWGRSGRTGVEVIDQLSVVEDIDSLGGDDAGRNVSEETVDCDRLLLPQMLDTASCTSSMLSARPHLSVATDNPDVKLQEFSPP